MGKEDTFPFEDLVGKEFHCGEETFMVESSDDEKAESGTDSSGNFYWEIPCPKCGGSQRYYNSAGAGVHLNPV